MAKTYLEYLQEILQSQEEEQNKQINDIEQKYSGVFQGIKDQYSTEIQKVNQTYDDYIDQSYVQKIIDQKQIEQTLANMGLTDSGLNRTQQTAAILSHSNRAGKYNSLKQQQIDSLAMEMQSKISDLRLQQEKEKTSVSNSFLSDAQDQAMEIFKNQLAAEAKVQAEQIKANSKSQNNTSSNKATSNSSKDETNQSQSSNDNKQNGVSTLTQTQKDNLEIMCNERIITKQKFSNERRLGNVSGTYEDYLKNTLLRWRIDGDITQQEYEYLLSYFGFNK